MVLQDPVQHWAPVVHVSSDGLPFVRVDFDDIELLVFWNQLSQYFSAQGVKSCYHLTS